jgi:trk system potassium uptake protein TrkH
MKHYIMLLRALLLILVIAAVLMFAPLIMAFVLHETNMIKAFSIPIVSALFAGLLVLIFTKKQKNAFRAKTGFLLVSLTWILMSFFGAIPYYLSDLGISFTDALFESSCGFATTGATTIANIEILPRSLMLWRGMTHWFGGMGIIVFTIALLPLLGVGGFQLIKAESPGPEKERITPKIAASAKILWFVYIGLTITLIVSLKLCGMEWFDALIHSFGLMASGGLSTKNAGLAHYNSAAIEIISTIFMLLAAVNFNIYFRIVKGKWKDVINNTELRVYLGIFAAASTAIALSIVSQYGSFTEALRHGSFYVASFISTTGAATIDYQVWPAFAQMVLFGLMFVGGCSSSTAGGIKVIRHVILFKQTGNELRRMIFPTGIFSIHINKKVGRKDVVYGVAGFVFVYGIILLVVTLVTAASGFDLFSSFSTSLAMLGNIGIGFGAVGPNQTYAIFPDHLKLLYSFVMILGRLELWTVLILFHPSFWRR